MTFKLSKRSISNMDGVHDDLKRVATRAIEITKIDFGIPGNGGKRSALEQNALYKEGLSMCDGYKKLSNHQSGNALDFYAYVDGKASWNRNHLTNVAVAILQAASQLGYKLEWGGNFKSFCDMPHFQLLE